MIPISGVHYFENWVIAALDIFCVVFLTFMKYVKSKFYEYTKEDGVYSRLSGTYTLTALVIIANIV